MKNKFCVDCKHRVVRPRLFGIFKRQDLCAATKGSIPMGQVELVEGPDDPDEMRTCKYERWNGWHPTNLEGSGYWCQLPPGHCGPEGRNFEPKTK